jgi:drug/metabolite transporter (DMT)-like permease
VSHRGRWLVIAATCFWGSSATLARYLFRDRDVPALQAVELRLLFAATMLGVWLLWRDPARLRIAPRDWGYFLVLGVFGLAAVQGSYYYSIAVLGVGLAILIQYLAPSLLVAWDLVRGVRVGPLTIVAVIGALAGTALLIGDIDPAMVRASPLQWAIGFSSAVSFAFYIVWSKRGLTRYRPETVLFVTFSIAAVLWTLVTPPTRILNAGYPADVWLGFLGLGVFSTLVPFMLFNAGLRRLGTTEAGILSTFEPVVAVVAATVFLAEPLRALQVVGALLVLGSAILSSTQQARGDPRRPAPLHHEARAGE